MFWRQPSLLSLSDTAFGNYSNLSDYNGHKLSKGRINVIILRYTIFFSTRTSSFMKNLLFSDILRYNIIDWAIDTSNSLRPLVLTFFSGKNDAKCEIRTMISWDNLKNILASYFANDGISAHPCVSFDNVFIPNPYASCL